MSNTATIANPEKAQQKISLLLDQLTKEYQGLMPEIPLIKQAFPANEEELSIIEEIELLTTDLRGYASQIKTKRQIKQPVTALDFLKKLQIFEIISLENLYFSELSDFPRTKQYLQKLDYLKLLLLEWLQEYQLKG